jgi:ribonuclease inhibitor
MANRPDIVLEGKKINSMSDFYDQLVIQLNLPDWFGRNFSALNDALNGDGLGEGMSAEGRRIVWKDYSAAKNALGTDFDDIVEIFEDNELVYVLE